MKKMLFGFIFLSLQVFAKPEVSIPGTVEISQRPLLRLGDIAVVTGAGEELLTFVNNMVLREDSRDLLLSQHLESQEILEKVRAALESEETLKNLHPTFKIPAQVKVSFSATPLSSAEVQRKILNYLSARCNSCDYEISLSSPLPVPAQKNWELDLGQMTTKGGFLLPLRDGDARQAKWISGTIRVSALTPVTTKLILQGERVQAQDVRLQKTDVTYAKDGILRIEDIQGQIAARSLAVGTPLWSSDLKRESATKKGQIVKVLLGDENFEISTTMQAEDSGFVGDLIKLKNLETQKLFSGLVTEKGVVKLQ